MRLEKNYIKELCLNKIKGEWMAADDSFPVFLTEIPKEVKEQNEQSIRTFSDNFQKQVKRFSHRLIGRKKWKQKTLTMIEDILYKETIIGIHNSMDQVTLDAFQEELKEFLRHVRQFAPELSIEDIGQAIRNYIVYAMFNVMHRVEPKFNIAGFGYSMLYPFTDNYIDSKDISDKEKTEYNQMIRDKIEAKEVHPKSPHQQKTCELLQMIESVYPRELDSTVFSLLLMMLDAQEDSLQQQQKGIPLTDEERLDISLYKGGISVFIDRFLVKKDFTDEDLIFYLEFGFFLQLADDLQDIKEDSIKGSQTLFTVDLHNKREEKLVNKLLHFVHRITDEYQAENDIFQHFVLWNCYQLIYTSIAGSKEFFSKDYLRQIERFLPVTSSFLENLKKSQPSDLNTTSQDRYIKILDEIVS